MYSASDRVYQKRWNFVVVGVVAGTALYTVQWKFTDFFALLKKLIMMYGQTSSAQNTATPQQLVQQLQQPITALVQKVYTLAACLYQGYLSLQTFDNYSATCK